MLMVPVPEMPVFAWSVHSHCRVKPRRGSRDRLTPPKASNGGVWQWNHRDYNADMIGKITPSVWSAWRSMRANPIMTPTEVFPKDRLSTPTDAVHSASLAMSIDPAPFTVRSFCADLGGTGSIQQSGGNGLAVTTIIPAEAEKIYACAIAVKPNALNLALKRRRSQSLRRTQ